MLIGYTMRFVAHLFSVAWPLEERQPILKVKRKKTEKIETYLGIALTSTVPFPLCAGVMNVTGILLRSGSGGVYLVKLSRRLLKHEHVFPNDLLL